MLKEQNEKEYTNKRPKLFFGGREYNRLSREKEICHGTVLRRYKYLRKRKCRKPWIFNKR